MNAFDKPAIEIGMRIFISYGHDRNAELVKAIKDYLSKRGYEIWIDTSEIPHGSDWRERITNGLMGSNGVLAFLSKHSVKNPGVCVDELRIAMRLKHSLVRSILLEQYDDVKPPARLTKNQWVDMGDWQNVEKENWDSYFEEKMDSIIEALEYGDVSDYTKEIQMISECLKVSENISKEQKLLQQSFVGRKWLIEQIEDWLLHGTEKKYVVFGVPGAGKSAFAANIAQYSPDVLASMYFEWDNPDCSDVDYVIKQLAYKLAIIQPDYRKMLVKILGDKEQACSILSNRHNAGLFDWLILDPITCCIDGNRPRGMIIFDGLDETSDEVKELLLRKSEEFPDWIRFVFLTRYDETILSRFTGTKKVILDQQTEQNNKDLALFFQERLGLSDRNQLCNELALKCEGSFMYARAVGDAIANNELSIDCLSNLPSRLNEFYNVLFGRLFRTADEYKGVRPFFELLSVEEELPLEILCECLNLDKYDLWDLRTRIKSLVVTAQAGRSNQLKSLKFVHKSIKDWITNQEYAGTFFVMPEKGYRLLAQCSESHYLAMEETGSSILSIMKSVYDEEEQSKLKQREINLFWRNNYPKWLVKSGEYKKYEQILLESFDEDDVAKVIKEKHGSLRYTYYYEYYDLWKWVDLLPDGYCLDALMSKLNEIIIFPKQYMCGNFAHRSFQITVLLLSSIMDSGRFAEAYYSYMRMLNFGGYFQSSASDLDGETRDGWDKYYMALHATICMKKLEKMHIEIPLDVRQRCENMRMFYHYYRGDTKSGMFAQDESSDHGKQWKFGILSEKELFKDLCILDDKAETANGSVSAKMKYNTLSLRYYLACSDEEDMQFISRCVHHRADLQVACESAIEDIRNDYNNYLKVKNASRRIQFIERIMEIERYGGMSKI